jgi:hypothetical protein
MNSYELKQETRRERMRERASNLRDQAAQEFRKGDLREECSGIPLGQPILVGHHSEKRHRRAIDRAHVAVGRGIAAEKKAEELERRADNPTNAISSDDPEAIVKLRAKIERAEKKQADMKAINHLVRKKDRDGLAALGLDVSQVAAVFTPDFAGRVGFPSYALTNNNANIRRMKVRIGQLEKAPTETTERAVGNVTVVENAEENRLQIFFPGKPSAEVRTHLKRNGFRWAPYAGAWQRHLNDSARIAAQNVLG